MKRIAVIILATFAFATASPLLAAEMTKEEKDMCLLASKNCANQMDSLQARIKKLQKEIKKGTRTYSAEELKKLELKLKEADEILKNLEKGGQGR